MRRCDITSSGVWATRPTVPAARPTVPAAFAALLAACLAGCGAAAPPTAGPVAVATFTPIAEPARLAERDGAPEPAAVSERRAAIAATLAEDVPIRPFSGNLDAGQQAAQALALADPQFAAYARDPETGAPLLGEVFGVYPLRDSDLTPATAGCRDARCYRVEQYNFARNVTILAVVDTSAGRVLAVDSVVDTQPDIPPHLTALAVDIAAGAPEVVEALGAAPAGSDAMMPNSKTALNRTRCERSKHLCVAPTFMAGERILWAIVDLTDLRLVGTRWTDTGDGVAHPPTEARLQDEAVTERYCERTTRLARDGWEMDYMLTSSDGLRVSDVRFQGRPVLDSAKLVDWHVSYSRDDGFGYSDAVGCPVFSQAAVVAVEDPRVEDLADDGADGGFVLAQDFWSEGWPLPCNYKYRQRYTFHPDGRFRVAVASVGRGCGDDGMYRPVLRLAFTGADNTFAAWDGAGWAEWSAEQWRLDGPATPDGYGYRIADAAGAGYYVEPGHGQFGDGGRGDDAYTYVTRGGADRDEGTSDLVTIGPCCNEDYRQGPEKFIEPAPEPIAGAPLVVWYVPQLKNDDTPGAEHCWAESVVEGGVYRVIEYPCVAGPRFVPLPQP